MSILTPSQKLELITRNLQEVVGAEKLKTILETRDLNVYWGTAPTGRPHIGYLVPIIKIGDLLRAGCKITILFADLHAYLDNMKTDWNLLEHRTKFYEEIIKAALECIGISLENLTFKRGTDYQLSKEFTLDVYKLSSLVTEHDAKKAGAEVVKQVDHPLLSGMLYPLLQALDEQYLGCDAQFGGVDQRKIFMFAEKVLPQLGYEKRIHLMNPMVPGLVGAKMSASDPDSKIDFLDDPNTVVRKIKKAFCEEGNIENNPLLSFCKMVLFSSLNGKPFNINRAEKFGGPISFANYEEMESAFAAKTLYPGDLKNGVTELINSILGVIRKRFDCAEMIDLVCRAYPGMPLPFFSSIKTEETAPKAQKAPKKPKQAPVLVEDVSRVMMQVGLFKSVAKHPDADSLLVETVDFGDHERTVVSGLAAFYAPEALLGRKAIFITNLKKGKLRGVLSEAMVMAASNEDHTQVEVVFAEDASVVPGERVVAEGFLGPADNQIDAKKKGGIWERVVQPLFSTNDHCEATWKGVSLKTEKSNKACTVKSLIGAQIH